MTLWYGTSSWHEKSWVGPFYPAEIGQKEWLTHYASQFAAVEADVTYYRGADEALVQGWNERTPEGFKMCAKFPRSIVHCGEGARPDPSRVLVPRFIDDDTRSFLDGMRQLGPKCGPLVLQFPYFNRAAFSTVTPFLERLDAFLGRLPDEFRYAVEIRNRSWVGPSLLDVLRRHRAALVLVDIHYMPHPADLARKHDLLTTDFIYARLIGDRQAVDDRTKTFDKIVIDRGTQLARWAELLRSMLQTVPDGWVFANNHFAGHGPATIRDLVDRFELGPTKD